MKRSSRAALGQMSKQRREKNIPPPFIQAALGGSSAQGPHQAGGLNRD